MKQAIIDIGSNSMRLTLYETKGDSFNILFREKIMAGLAGYVKKGILTAEGIECACSGLLTFRNILETLKIKHINIFATASLRNIANTKEALALIKAATGYDVEVISGQQEALLGYLGAMEELHISNGAFLDVGGASSEIVIFKDKIPVSFYSFPVGSLSLYKQCVKKILPKNSSLKKMNEEINNIIDIKKDSLIDNPLLVCVGGSARAMLKIARYYFKITDDSRSINIKQLETLCGFLCTGKKEVSDLILRLEPERIHTLIPGALILEHVAHLFKVQQLVVSKYGVREGYLCQKILHLDTVIPKTES